MRFSTFILSILILAMAIMPCEDAVDTLWEQESITHYKDSSHNHLPQHEDECTPFCICQCCGTSISLPILIAFEETNAADWFSDSFHYSSLYSFDYQNGVWHPPILS
ncbi:DUF6660 family protein [Wenyingzhuangia sp. 2_MG-2023]|uniref:DUF6660 family protein n=1 Tax=Wenyingzhuangia sp. 2_MG-2023 TaxID=3062639 RepID=UPI0026E3EFB0|nr:DUF6660 family protein [Wenyingzhuangia sp. 2_MG-2023]MDO6739122.1 hypothetical protein [Wenyingzhuangia sp. 2_MG-2023]